MGISSQNKSFSGSKGSQTAGDSQVEWVLTESKRISAQARQEYYLALARYVAHGSPLGPARERELEQAWSVVQGVLRSTLRQVSRTRRR